jgi:predicted O-linked N-acetylglucosamine transferase (SPINDLY family)
MKYPFTLGAVLAAAVLGGVAGCGGEERLSREEFSDRVQRIGDRGGELWGRLAQRAEDLQPDEPLPADVKQALSELVEFQEEAAAELEALNPPKEAEEAVESLVAALRERTRTFEQVIETGRFTEQDSERVTQAGEAIDQAFEQLRAAGFLATADDHEEE